MSDHLILESKIITFCSKNYIAELNAWIAKIEHSGIFKNQLKVYCFDDDSAKFCHNLNMSYVLLDSKPIDRKHVWVERCKIFLKLSQEGLDFIHSDLDALWDKDIRKYLSKRRRRKVFDIAFSCGTYNPPIAWKLHGFVLCAGLFYSRSNNKTIQFWENVLELAMICKDDQEAINNIFAKGCCQLKIQKKDIIKPFVVPGGEMRIPPCGFPVKFTTATCLMNDSEISIGIIPHRICSRVTYQQRGKFVNHPLLAPSKSRLVQYKELGLIPAEFSL